MEAESFLSKWPEIKARIDEHQVKLRHKRIKSIPSLLGSLKEGTEALVTKGARPDEHGIGQLRARECEYNSVASQIEKLFSSSSEKTRELLSEIGADAEMALKVCKEALYRRAEPIPNLPRLTAPQTKRESDDRRGETDRKVLAVLKAHPGGILGKDICKKIPQLSLDNLKNHVIRRLREKGYPVKNDRNQNGYYLDEAT